MDPTFEPIGSMDPICEFTFSPLTQASLDPINQDQSPGGVSIFGVSAFEGDLVQIGFHVVEDESGGSPGRPIWMKKIITFSMFIGTGAVGILPTIKHPVVAGLVAALGVVLNALSTEACPLTLT